MAFSFGFSGDDIDIDESENNNGVPDVLVPHGASNSLPEPVKPRKHDMNEWVSVSEPSTFLFNDRLIYL